jgi:hypothetical protein
MLAGTLPGLPDIDIDPILIGVSMAALLGVRPLA